MQVKSATVIRERSGTDHIMLHTDIPNPIWPYNDYLTVKFEAARGNGPEYVRRYFDIEPQVIKVDCNEEES